MRATSIETTDYATIPYGLQNNSSVFLNQHFKNDAKTLEIYLFHHRWPTRNAGGIAAIRLPAARRRADSSRPHDVGGPGKPAY
jgi:hypothetical protein